MKAIPYLVSGFAWFLIINCVVQLEVGTHANTRFFSVLFCCIAVGWLIYRSENKSSKYQVDKNGSGDIDGN